MGDKQRIPAAPGWWVATVYLPETDQGECYEIDWLPVLYWLIEEGGIHGEYDGLRSVNNSPEEGQDFFALVGLRDPKGTVWCTVDQITEAMNDGTMINNMNVLEDRLIRANAQLRRMREAKGAT
jgi:hypothetical protein